MRGYTHRALGAVVLTGFLAFSCRMEPTRPELQLDLSGIPLLPLPREIQAAPGSFLLDSTVRLVPNAELSDHPLLFDYLRSSVRKYTGLELDIREARSVRKYFWRTGEPDRFIALRLNKTVLAEEPEGYLLRSYSDSLILESSSAQGLFRGLQTFQQLLPHAANDTLLSHPVYPIPTGTIRDYPEWAYRGMMLDVARHFFSPDEVKALIDQLAFYKLNTLHLHLSDDQGWRLQIHSWPRLTEVGSASEVGGTPGGYYTQEEFRELVDYARDRGITIIPEFDMPGHTQAAIASYPELNGTQRPAVPYTGTRVGFSSLATRKELTYQWVDSLFREVAPLIGDAPIHIGGDESDATKPEDYRYFIHRIKQLADRRGIRLMGWEDIAAAPIDSTVVVQYWRGKKLPLEALNQGARVVLSPAWHAYLDMKYDQDSRYGLDWAGLIPLDSAYAWSPEEEFPEHRNAILGIEAPLWSETISQPDELEYLAFPRLLAYAELGWSSPQQKNWEDFKLRLAAMGRFMEAEGIDFYRSPSIDW